MSTQHHGVPWDLFLSKRVLDASPSIINFKGDVKYTFQSPHCTQGNKKIKCSWIVTLICIVRYKELGALFLI